MPEKEIEYRVQIHPSGEMNDSLTKQLSFIAKIVYGKETDKVVYRVLRVKQHSNPRKLYVPGDGEVVEGELLPHIGLGQKIVIEEKDEDKVIRRIEKVASDTKPFMLTSTKLGDYGEDFTIFVAYSQSDHIDELDLKIREKMKQFSPPGEKVFRDVFHFTLVYDDVSPENINKAWKAIEEDGLVNKELQVNSIWLWKNHNPYKEFIFGISQG